MKTLLVASIAVLALAAQFPASAQDKKVTWNLGYLSTPKTVYEDELAKKLPERLSRLTNGQLKVRSSSSLVPPTEHLSALKDGRLDAALVVHAYYSGEVPLLNINGLPGLFRTFEDNRIANEKILNERFAQLFEERYNSVFLLGSVFAGQVIWSREPIKTTDDFSGKKLRAHNTQVAQLLSHFDARPIAMPLGDFLPALQRGVVDGGILGDMNGVGLAIPQFAKYINDWRIGYTTAYSLVVNKESWEKLSEESRKAIVQDMKAYEAEVFKMTEAESRKAIELAKEMGTTYIKPDDSEIEKTRNSEAITEIYEQWHALNSKQGISDSQQVLQAVQRIMN